MKYEQKMSKHIYVANKDASIHYSKHAFNLVIKCEYNPSNNTE